MSKGQASHLYRHGAMAGYTEHRYGGDPKPVTLAGTTRSGKAKPLLSKDKRQHVIHEVIDQLRDWRASPFEREASLRHGLRESFCLSGSGWHKADAEALAIVAEGLRLIGAKRPDWSEGQHYHTVSPDFCAWCLGPIDEENRTRGQRFCSAYCAFTANEHLAGKEMAYVDAVRRSARRMITKSKAPPRDCIYCGKAFRSDQRDARFCSPRCASRSQKAESLLADIACTACGLMFKPKLRTTRFCSIACARPAARVAKVIELSIVERLCGCCGQPFTPTTDHALYCSHRCGHVMASRAYQARTYVPSVYHRVCEWCAAPFEAKMPWATFCCREHREAAKTVMKPSRRPRPISPPVFDYVFRMAA